MKSLKIFALQVFAKTVQESVSIICFVLFYAMVI